MRNVQRYCWQVQGHVTSVTGLGVTSVEDHARILVVLALYFFEYGYRAKFASHS